MKPKSILLLGLFLTGSAAAQEPPAVIPPSPPPLLEINTRGNLVELMADDRANGSWILQTSGDMRTWTNVGGAFHIRNRLQSLSPGPKYERPNGVRYFRMVSAPGTPAATREQMLDLPATRYPYNAQLRQSMSAARVSSRAMINDAYAELGRVLFYDRRLSKDNSISCASCHKQENSFADVSPLSTGHTGQLSRRNSVAPLDVVGYSLDPRLFWDGRSKSLTQAVLEPISDSVEMGMSLNELPAKLAKEPYYADLFQAASGSTEITNAKIGAALADFLESLPRFNSRFDQVMFTQVTAGAAFTAEEKAGYALYQANCQTCHSAAGSPMKARFENNGLDLESKDLGLAGVTGLSSDQGKFKVPFLRQISQTAPYMHDGRFKTLREVIDHYSDHMVTPTNLAESLKVKGRLRLTEKQKQELEAFLKTLTDPEVSTNPAFSDPFRRN